MANQISPQTPKSYLKVNSIIHLALFMGQLLFGVLVMLEVPQKGIDITNTNNPFLFVVPVVAIGSLILSTILFKKNLGMAINNPTLKGKLMGYQTALITRFAPLEGASLFGIVAYLQTGNLLFILITGLIMLYFLSLRPTKDRIANDLNLSYEDKMLFDSDEVLK